MTSRGGGEAGGPQSLGAFFRLRRWGSGAAPGSWIRTWDDSVFVDRPRHPGFAVMPPPPGSQAREISAGTRRLLGGGSAAAFVLGCLARVRPERCLGFLPPVFPRSLLRQDRPKARGSGGGFGPPSRFALRRATHPCSPLPLSGGDAVFSFIARSASRPSTFPAGRLVVFSGARRAGPPTPLALLAPVVSRGAVWRPCDRLPGLTAFAIT